MSSLSSLDRARLSDIHLCCARHRSRLWNSYNQHIPTLWQPDGRAWKRRAESFIDDVGSGSTCPTPKYNLHAPQKQAQEAQKDFLEPHQHLSLPSVLERGMSTKARRAQRALPSCLIYQSDFLNPGIGHLHIRCHRRGEPKSIGCHNHETANPFLVVNHLLVVMQINIGNLYASTVERILGGPPPHHSSSCGRRGISISCSPSATQDLEEGRGRKPKRSHYRHFRWPPSLDDRQDSPSPTDASNRQFVASGSPQAIERYFEPRTKIPMGLSVPQVQAMSLYQTVTQETRSLQ